MVKTRDEKIEDKLTLEDNSRLQSSAPVGVKTQTEDYLRQYQYRKQTIPGSKQSDPPPGGKAAAMKKFLLAEPKVRIFIPADGQEKQIKLSVTRNGYRLDLPRHQYIEVPQSVGEQITDMFNQTEIALSTNLLSGNLAKETALAG